jgi:hypothetical protein
MSVVEVHGCKNVTGTFLEALLEYFRHSLIYLATKLPLDGVLVLSKFTGLLKADIELHPLSTHSVDLLLSVKLLSMKVIGACYEDALILADHPHLMKLHVIGAKPTIKQVLDLKMKWMMRSIICAGGLTFSG